MVKAGWAIEYRQYSDGRNDREEAEAKAAKRGLWQVSFIERRNGETAAIVRQRARHVRSTEGCAIKGNISGSNRIYTRLGSRITQDADQREGR